MLGYVPFDYLIVGAGLSGCVLAERLATQAGKRVLLIDRRRHIGGNVCDYYDDDGILVHKYGPHCFHTNAEPIVRYLSQFTDWRPYEHRVLAAVDGQLLPVPINRTTVNRMYGLDLRTEEQCRAFFQARSQGRGHCRTSEEEVVRKVGRELYEKFFRGYTRKQWGLDPSELDASVTARIPIRTDTDDRYFTDTFQGVPSHGYTRMCENMLKHPNVTVMLGIDWREIREAGPCQETIFTGPIDEFFDCRYGKLPYRSLEFRHETLDQERALPVAQVNYPNEHEYTRVTEFKHITGQDHRKTSLVYEFPRAEGDPYYPIPRPENAALYDKYKKLADQTPGVYFAGRLATYKYYNMDQVVAQALKLFERIQGKQRVANEVLPA